MVRKAVIFGANDFAQVAAVYLNTDSDYRVAAFTVHQRYIDAPTLNGVPFTPFETLTQTHPPDEYSMFVAIGFSKVNRLRTEIYHQCKALGYPMLSYVSPRASLYGDVQIGEHCFIFENNVIQPFVSIGNNVIVWSGNHIGHHVSIGDNCFIASHAVISGRVNVGNNCFVGVNASFRDGVKVAPQCIIGAGAVILKDTVEKGVYKSTNTEPTTFKSDELRNF